VVAIYCLLQFSAFEPNAISAMTSAYGGTLRVLGLTDRQDPLTEIVAKKIIDVTRTGERDPTRLRRRGLEELGIRSHQESWQFCRNPTTICWFGLKCGSTISTSRTASRSMTHAGLTSPTLKPRIDTRDNWRKG
jgi:hypothetical protein